MVAEAVTVLLSGETQSDRQDSSVSRARAVRVGCAGSIPATNGVSMVEPDRSEVAGAIPALDSFF